MKRVQFVIDDVIWVFRDLTRQKPKSLFDNEYMKMLKRAHDEYGLKVQLNVFYRTCFWYGNDEFSLSDMTDSYKKEFEENSDWLKLGFHSKEEWPDYPYVNADYDLVNDNFNLIKNEVIRFAGENTFAKSVLPHWAPMSKEGVQALYDNGIRIMYASVGEKALLDADTAGLPYGHSFRLLHNKKPESGVYNKPTRDTAIARALCSYNHVEKQEYDKYVGKFITIPDGDIGMNYSTLAVAVLNLIPLEILADELNKYTSLEYITVGNHEQYFYSDYYAYQPDYAEKIYTMGKVLKENGYSYVFGEELPIQEKN